MPVNHLKSKTFLRTNQKCLITLDNFLLSLLWKHKNLPLWHFQQNSNPNTRLFLGSRPHGHHLVLWNAHLQVDGRVVNCALASVLGNVVHPFLIRASSNFFPFLFVSRIHLALKVFTESLNIQLFIALWVVEEGLGSFFETCGKCCNVKTFVQDSQCNNPNWSDTFEKMSIHFSRIC